MAGDDHRKRGPHGHERGSPEQQADVLLGNPPWVAYRHLSPEQEERPAQLPLLFDDYEERDGQPLIFEVVAEVEEVELAGGVGVGVESEQAAHLVGELQ